MPEGKQPRQERAKMAAVTAVNTGRRVNRQRLIKQTRYKRRLYQAFSSKIEVEQVTQEMLQNKTISEVKADTVKQKGYTQVLVKIIRNVRYKQQQTRRLTIG